MRILVAAMQVPDSRASVRVLADGSGIDPTGLKFVCSPFDEFAIEQAVQIRESGVEVEDIVAVTAGPTEAMGVLRTALAMGADRGIHLAGEHLPLHDEVAIARLMAAAIRRTGMQPDLVLCGRLTIDNDSGELGPALAEFLGMPHVGGVTSLAFDGTGTGVQVRSRGEGGDTIYGGPLPMLLACDRGSVEPRFTPLPAIMKAKKKPVETIPATELADAQGASTAFVGLQPPLPRPACRVIDGTPEEMAIELVRLLHEEAKVI